MLSPDRGDRQTRPAPHHDPAANGPAPWSQDARSWGSTRRNDSSRVASVNVRNPWRPNRSRYLSNHREIGTRRSGCSGRSRRPVPRRAAPARPAPRAVLGNPRGVGPGGDGLPGGGGAAGAGGRPPGGRPPLPADVEGQRYAVVAADVPQGLRFVGERAVHGLLLPDEPQ